MAESDPELRRRLEQGRRALERSAEITGGGSWKYRDDFNRFRDEHAEATHAGVPSRGNDPAPKAEERVPPAVPPNPTQTVTETPEPAKPSAELLAFLTKAAGPATDIQVRGLRLPDPPKVVGGRGSARNWAPDCSAPVFEYHYPPDISPADFEIDKAVRTANRRFAERSPRSGAEFRAACLEWFWRVVSASARAIGAVSADTPWLTVNKRRARWQAIVTAAAKAVHIDQSEIDTKLRQSKEWRACEETLFELTALEPLGAPIAAAPAADSECSGRSLQGTMTTNPAFWRDLGAQFRALPNPSKLAAVLGGGAWGVTDGSASERGLFRALATRGAIAAGVSGVDGWLNLLRDEGPHFYAPHGSKDEGGWIANPAQASAEYCVERETRAFELYSAADNGTPPELATQEAAASGTQEAELSTPAVPQQKLQGLTDELVKPLTETSPPASEFLAPRGRGRPRKKPNLHPEVEPYIGRVTSFALGNTNPYLDLRCRITLTDFCVVSGFQDDTVFGAWRRGDRNKCNSGQATRFENTLKLLPGEFLARLAKSRA